MQPIITEYVVQTGGLFKNRRESNFHWDTGIEKKMDSMLSYTLNFLDFSNSEFE